MSGRLLRGAAAVLFVAILVHVIAILLIPAKAPHVAVDRIMASMPAGRLTLVDRWHPPVPDLDPAFVNAICPLTAEAAGLGLTGTLPDVYWSVAVIADSGRIVSALTHGDQDADGINLLVLPADAPAAPPAAGAPVTVELPSASGLILVSAFVPARGERPAIEAAVAALDCHRLAGGQ